MEDLDEEDADDEDEDGSDEDEDEEDDDDEAVQSKRLLNEEIRDLEAAVRRKENEIAGSANPLIRVSFPPSPHFSTLLADVTCKLAPFRGRLEEIATRLRDETCAAR